MKCVMLIAALASAALPAAGQTTELGQRRPAALPGAESMTARHVVEFWRDAGPALWFAKDPEFDALFRRHLSAEHEAAARGELEHWMATPEGALALMVLLDQYPRNSFRGTARMYAFDTAARAYADLAIARGHDRAVPDDLAVFFYLPFAHSEELADQDRAVELCRRLGEHPLSRAEHHRDIVRRFGRFPHRNPILGRAMRPEEQRYLDNGGYSG